LVLGPLGDARLEFGANQRRLRHIRPRR
jgi:hypothetical protein